MLHDQDTKMVLKNPLDPYSLFSMDIERGKVVEEWKIHEDITVDHIAPDNKFAQTTREQTLVGASHNALFRVDPRISGNKMVESQYKQYVSKNKFSGVATTASGKLAVASEKGDIRLFDTIGKNAKTALPPLGDPILGIDVTASGRWIVATTKTYLLLIDTLIGEGRYAGNLGFDRSFPANAKPMPRRLQLRSEHVAYMNHDISFSVARYVPLGVTATLTDFTQILALIKVRGKKRMPLSQQRDSMSSLGTLQRLRKGTLTSMKSRSTKTWSFKTISSSGMINKL
jgi:hypothetical protein